jgi:hypothetical protein
MPKKKFDPNAPYTKTAFDPNALYTADLQDAVVESQPKSVWERLKEGFAGPVRVKGAVSEGELATAPRFIVPGGSSTPLAQGLSEAQAAATVGAGLQRPLGGGGFPEPSLGVANIAKTIKESSRIFGKGTSKVAEQLARPASETVRAPASTSGAAPPEVVVADVPRAAQPGIPPGSMQSVPREQLPGLIQSRTAGAPEAFQASGGRVLFRGAPEWSEGVRRPIGESTVEPPTNAIAARTSAPTFSTDSMGIKWAEGLGGVRVSIPKRISESEMMNYAKTKLAEQAAQQQKIKGSL